jgi:hypothetical protein
MGDTAREEAIGGKQPITIHLISAKDLSLIKSAADKLSDEMMF